MALQSNYNINIIYQSFQDIDTLAQVDNTITSTITKTVTVSNAYIKIDKLTGDKTKISLVIGIYTEKNGTLIDTDTYEFVPDTSDTAKIIFKQAYEQLKTNKYTTATDLLDEEQTA